MILSLGGGVAGDLGGFIAATYLRGIPYIQIPTTLLAMVDSSIGGKVGVNTKYGKNLIGTFWQPRAVLIDPSLLKTLPRIHQVNGLCEIMKIFLTCHAENFILLGKRINKRKKYFFQDFENFLKKAIQLKIKVIEGDVHETGERLILNFGHTIGHALELVSCYKMPHGIAIALGILVESKISELMDVLPTKDYQLIEKTIQDLGINKKLLEKFSVEAILKATSYDKKRKNNKNNYVILEAIGKVNIMNNKFVQEVAPGIVRKALKIVMGK